MIPPITREEHYQILNETQDGIGYCHKMFNLKANQNLAIVPFVLRLKVWAQAISHGRMGMMDAAEHIKKHFSEKFA